MVELLESDLDEYSRFAVRLILARFSDWEKFATISKGHDGLGSVVEFNVPCPAMAAESGLWVSTADEELSVGFHTYHCHFTDYENRFNTDQIEDGLQHAADIVDERVGIVTWYCGDRWAGSRIVALPHQGPLPGLFRGSAREAELAPTFGVCDRATLRSWHGRFDRDEIRTEGMSGTS